MLENFYIFVSENKNIEDLNFKEIRNGKKEDSRNWGD